MGMLLLNAAPSRDVCITDLLFVTVRRSYCISHKYPLQRPISCVIVSITKLLIVIGSPRAYLSRNWRAITWVFNKPFAGSGHMVQNKLHWDANDAVALPKQRNSYQSSSAFFCFGSPTASFASQCNLFCTIWPDPAKGLLQVSNLNFFKSDTCNIGYPCDFQRQ